MMKPLPITQAILVLAVGFSLVAAATGVDDLVNDLAGSDEKARSVARQLLSRGSIEAVPKILPLLAHEDPKVWCAAFNVLADFANVVSMPGREAERDQVADWLMTLVAPNQSYEIKERGLRLLALVVPEGHSVKPIAALLNDRELREKARAALEEIGTHEAADALCKALRKADPDFQCAIFNALSRIQDEKSLWTTGKWTQDDHAEVRVAAARALSWTGNPAYVKLLREVRAQAGEATMFDATDALLRLADAIARKGANWETAMAVYREVLESASSPVLQGAAIAGLGRFGDETVVQDILAALETENGSELGPAALAAFQDLQGEAANRALLDAYPNLSDEMQFYCLGVFGRKHEPVFLDVLERAASSGDEALRCAAWEALADSRLPAAVPVLAGTADSAAAVACLARLADVLGHAGEGPAAGRAYLAVYRNAESDEARAEALEGVTRFPVPEAFDVVVEALETAEFDERLVGTLAGIAKSLAEAGQVEEADHAVELLMAHATTTKRVRGILQVARAREAIPDLAHRLGFVTVWRFVGPFPWSMDEAFTKINVNEPDVDLAATYKVGDGQVGWKPYTMKDPSGTINFRDVFGGQAHVCAYGLAEIELPEDTEAVVRVGSDDGIKVWVNGAVVHEHNVDRGSSLDQDQAEAMFKAGKNAILVEVTQGGGGWGFCVRLTRPDGSALPFRAAK